MLTILYTGLQKKVYFFEEMLIVILITNNQQQVISFYIFQKKILLYTHMYTHTIFTKSTKLYVSSTFTDILLKQELSYLLGCWLFEIFKKIYWKIKALRCNEIKDHNSQKNATNPACRSNPGMPDGSFNSVVNRNACIK